LDCGGGGSPRRFRTAKVIQFFFTSPLAKAVSPLRFATAVQKTGNALLVQMGTLAIFLFEPAA
jgi:hypothetical protein